LAPVKDVLISTGYRLGWKLINRVPESWARWGFDTATNIAWRRQGHGVQMLENNLSRVLGPETTGKELRKVSKAGMRSYGRYWMEVFRLPSISAEQIQRDMVVNADADQALADAAAGKGVIFALPHMGNWEVAGAYVVGRGIKFTTVAERLKPESVFDMFVAFREGLGMEVLPLTGGPNIFGVLAQRLRAGHMVCLLCDRDLTESGVEVEFFGEKARMAAGPAALAIQTGAALYGVTLWFTEDGWVAHCDPVPVPAEGTRKEKAAAMTQQLASVFEQGIAAHPQDWHMLQRVFISDLDPARLPAAPPARAQAGLCASASSARTPGTSPVGCSRTSGT